MKELKTNEDIEASAVFLIDQNGQSIGVTNRDQALYLAFDAGLDLVQVSSSSPPAGGPPVAKIMDYGKYRYAQKKLESRQKVKTKAPEIKEIRISLKINPHDLDFKVKLAQKFLKSGDKVKISLKLIGREMMFVERAKEALENFRKMSEGEFEGPIEKLGSRFSAIIVQGGKQEKVDEAKNR